MVNQERSAEEHEDKVMGVGFRRRLPTFLSVAALAIGGFGVAACGDDESAGPEAGGAGAGGADVVEEEPEEGATGQPAEVTLTELLENPEAYVGQMVTVSGQVTDQEVDGEEGTAAAFTLGETVDEDLLVLPTAELTPEGITDESVIRVQGMVHEVNDTLADEEEFLFEEEEAVDDEFLSDFQDQVAIAATQIDTNIPRTDESGGDEEEIE